MEPLYKLKSAEASSKKAVSRFCHAETENVFYRSVPTCKRFGDGITIDNFTTDLQSSFMVKEFSKSTKHGLDDRIFNSQWLCFWTTVYN